MTHIIPDVMAKYKKKVNNPLLPFPIFTQCFAWTTGKGFTIERFHREEVALIKRGMDPTSKVTNYRHVTPVIVTPPPPFILN
jgi:hypothetical protein